MHGDLSLFSAGDNPVKPSPDCMNAGVGTGTGDRGKLSCEGSEITFVSAEDGA